MIEPNKFSLKLANHTGIESELHQQLKAILSLN